MTDLTNYLFDELDRALVGPVRSLLGDDLGDLLEQRLTTRARMLAGQLTADDNRVAAETVIDLMAALFPLSDPPHGWWRSPLGRVCAASFGHDDAEAVSRSVAQAMLGISRQRLQALLDEGKLDRHPDGGVVRASVMQRLAGRS